MPRNMKAAAALCIACCCLLLCACRAQDTRWDRKPAVMVSGVLYLDTGKAVPVEMDESALLGAISSSVAGHELPTEDGQSNFGCVGAKYAHFEGELVVLLNHEWYLFEKETP